MDQKIVDADVQPFASTFTGPEQFLYFGLVAFVGSAVPFATDPTFIVIGIPLAIGLMVGFRAAYINTHTTLSTEAWLEDDHLVFRDPNPWWKRLALSKSRKVRLEVKSVETGEETVVVSGTRKGFLGQKAKYTVSLTPADQVPSDPPVLKCAEKV